MFVELGYLGLFIATFLAATIIPMGSEVVLVTLLALGFDTVLCVLIATLGNSLGGMTSFFIGWLAKWEWIEKWFKVKREKVENFQHKIRRWGVLAGLFAWLPFIGDVIAIALGFMRLNPYLCCLMMFIGRLIRFSVVGGLMQLI